LILTAARTGEVLEAKWSEIDLDQAAWTIPADRMKAGREHRVPLAPRCIELLERAKVLAAGSDFVFPGRSNDKPMSNMVLLMMVRRLKAEWHGARFPIGVPGLGVGAHQFCARHLRGGVSPHHQGQDRGGL
jgi:integrase